MKHGGDLLSYEGEFSGELVDYSSNINPLGPPELLKEKIDLEYDKLLAYPDIKYRKLKEAVGKYLKCSEENILVGNGAMEIIDLFNLISTRVITMSPAFSEYSLRARVHGKDYLEIGYREDFSLDMDRLEKEVKEGDLIIIGNPNNPTGLRLEKEELLSLYRMVSERKAYLVLDEAFFEFVPDDYDSIEVFKEYDYKNIGIIRAATKFFAIPGIRLGYGCVSKEMASYMSEKQLTWSVNVFAEIAGRYIFEDQAYIERSKSYIEEERNFLLSNLKEIEGLEPYKSLTNYILIKLLNKNEEEVFKALVKKGFVVRKCSSFKVLGNNHIRIAVKDRKNNERLIKALKEIEL